MNNQLRNELGYINIDKYVISQIAFKSAMESYGLVGLGYKSKVNGIVELLKKENAHKGIKVQETEEGNIEVELYVVIQYGINISTVANNIIDKVKYTIENLTSLKVSKIDINVQGIRVK